MVSNSCCFSISCTKMSSISHMHSDTPGCLALLCQSSQPWRSQVGAKPPHQRSQPRPSPATRAGTLSVSSRSTWGACLRAIEIGHLFGFCLSFHCTTPAKSHHTQFMQVHMWGTMYLYRMCEREPPSTGGWFTQSSQFTTTLLLQILPSMCIMHNSIWSYPGDVVMT